MQRGQDLNFLLRYVNKYEVDLSKYFSPPVEDTEMCQFKEDQVDAQESLLALQDIYVPDKPKLCMWMYMKHDELETFLKETKKYKIKHIIEAKLPQRQPTGVGRIILVELIYSVTLFCKSNKFNLEQTGTALSLFYLTHRHLIGSSTTSAFKLYTFFKERLLLHCYMDSPDATRIFDYFQARKVIMYFITLYLRFIPLIRLLVKPNFGMVLDYKLEPEVKKKGKDKGKKK